MRTPEEWSRSYREMTDEDFVAIPSYETALSDVSMEALERRASRPETIPVATAKLYYSTRFFGRYDLDSGEFEAAHPGIDLKLPLGTPIGAVAGGRVHAVRRDERLGLHVVIEHRHSEAGVFYSIYGHLGTVSVSEGDDVEAGKMIGAVGMTGMTSGPHLHLQIDRGGGDTPHVPYHPSETPSPEEADRWAVHPIKFIASY